MTTNAERETHLNLAADDRSIWHVASNDPVMIARLQRIGADLVSVKGETVFFTLRADQVLLRKGKRHVSDATRHAAAQRLRVSSRTEAERAK